MAQVISAEFAAQLGRSMQLVGEVDLLSAQGTVVYSTDQTVQSLPMVVDDATLTDDRARTVRGISSVTLLIPDGSEQLIPTTVSSLLTPTSGAMFRLRLGLDLPSGAREVVTCGTYLIDRATTTETAAGIMIVLEGVDLSARVSDARLLNPYSQAAGANYVTAIRALLTPALPAGTQFITDTTSYVTPTAVISEQSDRLVEARKMATAIGFDLGFDALGRVILQREPTSPGDPSWTFSDGEVRQVAAVHNSFSREKTYNIVVVRGENKSDGAAPVGSIAYDLDPNSPWYYNPFFPASSPLGPRPYFMTSEFITTQAQADSASNAKLRKLKALTQLVELEVTQNPAIEIGDVLAIERPGVGVVGRYVVARRQLSLKPSPMRLACEERRV